MYALLMDTSTERGLVAFAEGKKILYQKELVVGFNQSQKLLPEIADGFNFLGIKPEQLAYIGVGVGPGSYTGIRVAAAVAKTYAFACQIPLVGFCSLEGFIPQQEGLFAAFIDAKMSGVYALKGMKREGLVSYSSQPQVIPLQLADSFLKDIDFFITPQSTFLRPKLEALFPQLSGEWQESAPEAAQIAFLAYHKFCKGDFSKDGFLDLLYLRRTQAEIERENRRQEIIYDKMK